MALTINGSVWADGQPLTVGGVQVQLVTCNAVEVWRNNSIPTMITDFVATDTLVGEITFTWTNAEGVPAPTYNVMTGTTVIGSNVTDGFTATVTEGTTEDYYVNAVNTAGTTASNIDSGSSAYPPYVGPPSPVTITSTKDVVAGVDFPANVAITACIGGAGGSGATTYSDAGLTSGGGYGGTDTSSTTTFTSGQSVSAVIGAGGASVSNISDGNAGGSSSFNGVSASGGAGGTSGSDNYAGNGQARSSCYGTTYAGARYVQASLWISYGGGAGTFGNGGNGSFDGNAGDGGVGAGGGAALFYNTLPDSGAGGRGQVVLSW